MGERSEDVAPQQHMHPFPLQVYFSFSFKILSFLYWSSNTDGQAVTNASTKSIQHTVGKEQDKKSAHDTRLSAR